MGASASSDDRIPDPERDIEIEQYLLNLPDPEVPNITDWDLQNVDFMAEVRGKYDEVFWE